eukprot:TRINITY_DN88903_c0_g1_i1.p1 TRINITY_DN88903_c0_g1~~TRINITY_DN88903_c0_g1_i1.p1  ORF type:complete len:362 (+),score=43.17 TRINITY_DN88903_c0_g1_i1:78-1163(+)
MKQVMQSCFLVLLIVLLVLSAFLCVFLPITTQGVGTLPPAAPPQDAGGGAVQSCGSDYSCCGDALSLDTSGFQLLKALCFEPTNILDIGANVGEWTTEFRELFPKASFLMLDGNNYTASEAWREIRQAGNGRVDQDTAVLGRQDGEIEWFTGGLGDTGASIFVEMSGNRNKRKAQTRRIETLDNFLQRTGRNMRFQLIKMDVQGAEVDVIAGATETLKNAEVLLLEMPVAGTYNENAPSFFTYIAALDAAGFTVFDMPQQHRLTEAFTFWGNAGFLVQVDFIFVRKGSRFLSAAQRTISTVFTPAQKKIDRPFWYHQTRLSNVWLYMLRAMLGITVLIVLIFVAAPLFWSIQSDWGKVRTS